MFRKGYSLLWQEERKGCPMPCNVFSHIPSLCPLDAGHPTSHPTLPVLITKCFRNYATYSGKLNCPPIRITTIKVVLQLSNQNQMISILSTWFSTLLQRPTERSIHNIKKKLIVTYLKVGIVYQMQPFEQCVLVCPGC